MANDFKKDINDIEKDVGTFSEVEAPLSDKEKYKALIDKYESIQNAPKQEIDWRSALPDMAAAAANIINFSEGSQQKNFKLGSVDAAKSAAKAKKTAELEGVAQLQNMYQKYMSIQEREKDRDLKEKLSLNKKSINDKIYQTRSGIVKIGKDGEVTTMYEDPYMKKRGEISESSLDLRKDKFSDKKIQKNSDDSFNALKSLRGTDTWKSAEKTISNIPEIEVLLDDAYKNGGQSLAMLGPRIAKGIAGEVGVLTEADVTRYVKNPELIGGLLDTLKKLKSGKITEASYDNLKRLLGISKKTAAEKINTAIDREAILLSRREKMPFEEAKFLLDSSYKTSSSEKVKKEDGFLANIKIKKIMEDNPGVSREAVIKALKKEGKL